MTTFHLPNTSLLVSSLARSIVPVVFFLTHSPRSLARSRISRKLCLGISTNLHTRIMASSFCLFHHRIRQLLHLWNLHTPRQFLSFPITQRFHSYLLSPLCSIVPEPRGRFLTATGYIGLFFFLPLLLLPLRPLLFYVFVTSFSF